MHCFPSTQAIVVANPNPVQRPENLSAPRFKKGQSGNPGGIPRETLRLIRENAQRATRIRSLMLEALEKKLTRALEQDDVAAAASIQAEINTFLKDSENRGLGTPTQQVQLTGAEGGPVQTINREMSDAEAAELYQRSLSGGLGEGEDEQEGD